MRHKVSLALMTVALVFVGGTTAAAEWEPFAVDGDTVCADGSRPESMRSRATQEHVTSICGTQSVSR